MLGAYAVGAFPMADAHDADELFWVEPKLRAVFPLDHFQPSRSLKKAVRQDRFAVTADGDFEAECAGDTQCSDDIGDAIAACDQRRSLVHQAIVYSARFLVAGVRRLQNLSFEASGKLCRGFGDERVLALLNEETEGVYAARAAAAPALQGLAGFRVPGVR